MLTWADIGTMAGAVAIVHAALYLGQRIWPHLPTTTFAIIMAEAVTWGYGASTEGWAWTAVFLWVVNGLLVATVALGGSVTVQTLVGTRRSE
jgi:hypothetical protein